MFKKVNIIIISIFSVLTIKYNVGYSLFIPIVIFYSLKDIRNSIYIFLCSTIITLLVNLNIINHLILLGILGIVLFSINYILKQPINKISNNNLHLIIFLLIFITNITINYFILKYTIIHSTILSFVSVLLYAFFEYNLITLLKRGNNSSTIYLEIIIYLITTLGSSTINISNINIGLIVSSFYSIILTKKYQNIYPFIYSLIVSIGYILFLNNLTSLFIPIITSFYLLPSTYAFITFNFFVLLCLLTNNNYINDLTTFRQLISFMLTSVIFELISPFISIKSISKDEDYEYIYNTITKNVNNELSSISLFLDNFVNVFKYPKDYNEKLSNSIKVLVEKHCDNCLKQKECFNRFKEQLYDIFRLTLLKEIRSSNFFDDIYRYCPNFNKLEYTANFLGNKEEFKQLDYNNNGLIAQIVGVNNAVKKLSVELASIDNLNVNRLNNLKKNLIEYGLKIENFEIKKLKKQDYLINIYMSLQTNTVDLESIKEVIKTISENILQEEVTINHYINDNKSIYTIIPKVKIDVIYGFANLSSNSQISGDNYFIKDLNNGRLIVGISDGMGKGYNAFKDSNTTLKLVNDVTNINIPLETTLQILNSFYTVQDYFEHYATLDLVEINRYESTISFYKMGGSSSYIIHENNKIDEILNKSLPFGIDEEVPKLNKELKHNDLILISSDGIFENIEDTKELNTFLNSIKEEPPQKIAYDIIDYTLNTKTKTKDDMSIIVLKIKDKTKE